VTSLRRDGTALAAVPLELLLLAIATLGCDGGKGTPPATVQDASLSPLPSDALVDPPPIACQRLAVDTPADFETKFIAPRCGQVPAGATGVSCHSNIFPPYNLDKPGMVRASLVDQFARTLCKTDKYINRADLTKSFVLTKIDGPGDMVPCPSGGALGLGGFRMPDQGIMPRPALVTPDERACLLWYMTQLAR
jgi:hypothetical protein